MAVSPPVCNFGWKALEFELPSTAGKKVDLNQVKGPNGTLIMFICNHCPYVTSAIDRIIFDATELMDLGIGVVSICSNDAITYPDDSFDKMIEFAKNNNFPFPYLHDENQEIAKSYDAECTPDFFGFNSKSGTSISWPLGQFRPYGFIDTTQNPRSCKCHEGNRQFRQWSKRPDSFYGLFDKMEIEN